jgi:hypothetical protein
VHWDLIVLGFLLEINQKETEFFYDMLFLPRKADSNEKE